MVIAIALLKHVEASVMRAAIPIGVVKTDHICHDLPCPYIDFIAVSMARCAVEFGRFYKGKAVDIGAFEIICTAMCFVREGREELIFVQRELLRWVRQEITVQIGCHRRIRQR